MRWAPIKRACGVLLILATVILMWLAVRPTHWSYTELSFEQLQTRLNSSGLLSKRPQVFAEPQVFHPIGSRLGRSGRPCILAYSAYFDHRQQAVKVVADSEMSCFRSVAIVCQIWYETYADPHFSELSFYFHMLDKEEGEGERLGAVYCCKGRPNVTERPYAVTFISKDSGSSFETSILSMRIHKPWSRAHRFAVCVPALFGTIEPESLVEFVEVHRLLGAEKFYFYKEYVSAEAELVLQAYQSQGVVEMLQWHSVYPELVGYHNQLAMQADCSLRNLLQATYVAQMDIDEFLLPANGVDWHGMVNKLEQDDTGGFIFRQRLFSLNETIKCYQEESPYDFSSTKFVPTYLRRLVYYNVEFEPGVRSKIMYRPERVEKARTHDLLLRPGYKNVVLSYSEGAVNHYRSTSFLDSNNLAVDYSMCAYSKRLTTAFQKQTLHVLP